MFIVKLTTENRLLDVKSFVPCLTDGRSLNMEVTKRPKLNMNGFFKGRPI